MTDSIFKKMCISMQAFFTDQLRIYKNIYKIDTGTDKDYLWRIYLDSFNDPAERQHNNCNCCRSFIRRYGDMVFITSDYRVISIWDFHIDNNHPYYKAIKALSSAIVSLPIKSKQYFLSDIIGEHRTLDAKRQKYWDHFALQVVSNSRTHSLFLTNDTRLREKLSLEMAEISVVKRSLEELSLESVESALALIASGSVYRGNQFVETLTKFKDHLIKYHQLNDLEKNRYIHKEDVYAIRNSAIGSFLIDLNSPNLDLDSAIARFNLVMNPYNYQRPTVTTVTVDQQQSAKDKVIELGLEESLSRRHANIDDLDLQYLLYKYHPSIKSASPLDVLDSLTETKTVDPRKFHKQVSDISLTDFLAKVVPTASDIEILMESRLAPHLMSIIAPVNRYAPPLFKWNNPFSWCYKGAITDSYIAERVKNAGGSVSGKLRVSLAWNSYTDLDLHLKDPTTSIWTCFNDKSTKYAKLDVDANVGNLVGNLVDNPVENITFENEVPLGEYVIKIHNFTNRSNNNEYTVEVAFGDKLYTLNGKSLRPNNADCYTFNITSTGIVISDPFKEANSSSSSEVWGLRTQAFHRVLSIIPSPNSWDNPNCGNTHTFFILEGALNNDKQVRGFFNEFLTPELHKYRRVFELLGYNLLVPFSLSQLSGLGFSSKNSYFYVRVTNSIKQVMRVTL